MVDTDGFGDTDMLEQLPDILSLTLLEVSAMTNELKLSALRLKSVRTDDLRSVSDLKRRLTEFIHLSSLNNKPVKLRTLNSKFVRVAKRFDTNINLLTQELLVSGHVTMLERHGISALVSVASQTDRRALLESYGDSFSDAMNELMTQAI